MTTLTKTIAVTALAAGAFSTSTFAEAPAKPASRFYKDTPLFSTAASEILEKQPIEHFGPVGMGIDLLLPPFQMQLSRIDKGSPAEATGKLKVGQWIESINGEKLKDIDPRIQLAAILTKVEATDGVIKFMVKDKPDAQAGEVIVKIPVLGAYSKTWPLSCPKSDKIVRNEAEFLARTGANGMGLGQLFLLSTGDEKDLEVVRGWVCKQVEQSKNTKPENFQSSPWYSGYSGIGLCEYYLRTGDETVIPLIEKHADYLRRNQYNGGWNQKGGINFSYGHLNAAGVPSTTFLLLAKECGAKIDDATMQDALRQFYRFAGHHNVAYGDHTPDVGFVDNGKTGKLAFQMAAAATLTPEGENSVYAKARDISAVKSFYSTNWMLHGHTGGGIGEIWRSASMGLMHDKTPLKYREFMDKRQWFYELSRRFDGSMGIVSATFGNGGRYDDPDGWGIGLALSYTIPRKHLRIAGAPATKFAKSFSLPKRPWGTEADEMFISLTSTPGKDGKVPDWDQERLATDGSAAISRRLNEDNVADEVIVHYVRHFDQGVRGMAANAVARKGSAAMIVELLKDKDPRVRHAGTAAIATLTAPTAKGEAPQAALLTDEMVALLIGIINDPNESWWVVMGALENLGIAKPELLAPHVDRLCYWLEHEEWWLQKGALIALSGLIADERHYQKLLPILGKLAGVNRRSMISWDLWGKGQKLATAPPAVQALATKVFSQAYGQFPPKLKAKGGLDMANAEGLLVNNLADSLSKLPGGLDVLLALANKRYPDAALPHKDLFFNADNSQMGPELKKTVHSVIREQLIPEYVATHSVALLAESGPAPVVANLQTFAKAEGLVELYGKMEVKDYDWHGFGTAWDEMKWDYFTFDPPETMSWNPGGTRYRKVTYPAGMENWFATDFDAKKVGWQNGLQPFGQENGKLRTTHKPFYDQLVDRAPSGQHPCPHSFCRCCDPMKTFWDKEVLLMRGTFQIPPLKPGHRYRLVVGGHSNMNNGDGMRVYVNGSQVLEREREFKKREGGVPVCYVLDQKHLDSFQSGTVTIAATGFLHIHLRSKNKGNFMAVWLEEMKMPPLDQEVFRKAASVKPLTNAAWQAIQNPDDAEADPENGKYKWDGKFQKNKAVLGAWTQVGQVASIDALKPGEKLAINKNLPLQKIEFRENGLTDDPLCYWSGDTLIHLAKLEALKMTTTTVDGTEYLLIEVGGFATKNKAGWKPPLYVMKRIEMRAE